MSDQKSRVGEIEFHVKRGGLIRRHNQRGIKINIDRDCLAPCAPGRVLDLNLIGGMVDPGVPANPGSGSAETIKVTSP